MASSSKKVIYAAFVGNGLIAIVKFIAAAMTGSSAILSEGIHSVVDTGNQALLLYGIRRAKRPADKRFPFGHGKEVYFWSFIVSILIFAVGAGVSLYEGISHVLHPGPVRDPFINYIILVLAMIFEGFAWYFAFKEFRKVKGQQGYLEAVRKGKDPIMFVVLFEDSAAMLGLIVAFVGIMLSDITGASIYDGAASIVIGLILAGTALWLAFETKSLLIGESADPELTRDIQTIAGSYASIEQVNEILTMHMGPEYILVNVSVDFNNEVEAADVESTIADLDARIKKINPLVRRVFVEAESRSASKAIANTDANSAITPDADIGREGEPEA